MLFFKHKIRKVVLPAVIAAAVVFGILVGAADCVRAEENACASLSLKVAPPYIQTEAPAGTVRIFYINLERNCPAALYRIRLAAEPAAIAPWFSFDSATSLSFAAGELSKRVRVVISFPRSIPAGEYEGAINIGLIPARVSSQTGTTINTNLSVNAPVKLIVKESGGDLNESGEALALTSETMFDRLRGRIILRAESRGQAYYVHPRLKLMYYLGRPADALRIMRGEGEGISNKDLEKIPAALPGADDTPVIFLNSDAFAVHNSGRIFLQTEEKGEAWYLNPEDRQRYFLGSPEDAWGIMRRLSLGIGENDFNDLFY